MTPSPPTAAAACSTSSTTASACEIMTASEAPSIVTVFFDPARSATNASRPAEMLLSRVPKMNQDGIPNVASLIRHPEEALTLADEIEDG